MQMPEEIAQQMAEHELVKKLTEEGYEIGGRSEYLKFYHRETTLNRAVIVELDKTYRTKVYHNTLDQNGTLMVMPGEYTSDWAVGFLNRKAFYKLMGGWFSER